LQLLGRQEAPVGSPQPLGRVRRKRLALSGIFLGFTSYPQLFALLQMNFKAMETYTH
jgi:hypothetical protein